METLMELCTRIGVKPDEFIQAWGHFEIATENAAYVEHLLRARQATDTPYYVNLVNGVLGKFFDADQE